MLVLVLAVAAAEPDAAADALALVSDADVDAADAEALVVEDVAEALSDDVVVTVWAAVLEVSEPEAAGPTHCVNTKAAMAMTAMMAMTMAAILPPLRSGAAWKLRGFLDCAE